jgi:hypothetical protein
MTDLTKPPVNASRDALELWLTQAADADSGIRAKLLQQAPALLEQAFGRKPPADIKLNVVEERPTDLFLVRRFEGAGEAPNLNGSRAHLLRASVHAIAMREQGFWEKLASDPKTVLADRLALGLPPGVTAHVLNEDPGTAYLVLHHPSHLNAWVPPPSVLQGAPVK